MIGARIVIYYKTDVPTIKEIIKRHFNRVEETRVEPDDVTKFGYEGFHMICFIPNSIFSSRENPDIGDFFELQIKTLYQHAWSQANHGLGYKPGATLTPEKQRLWLSSQHNPGAQIKHLQNWSPASHPIWRNSVSLTGATKYNTFLLSLLIISQQHNDYF